MQPPVFEHLRRLPRTVPGCSMRDPVSRRTSVDLADNGNPWGPPGGACAPAVLRPGGAG